MIRRPPRSKRTDTLLPYTTLFRSPAQRLAATRVVPRRGIAAGSHFTALEPRPRPDAHWFVGTVSDAQVVILVGADGDRITGGPGLDHLDLDRGPRAAAQYQPRRHHEQDCCQLAHVRPHPLHRPGCSIRPPRHAGNAHARALVGAASGPSPAKAGKGWGGVFLGISPNRGHPLPTSPCLRRGRGNSKARG